MDVNVEFIAASCNLTYNCLELTSELLIFASNHAVVVYDLEEKKAVKTFVQHAGRVNCLRFLKQSRNKFILSAGADGQLILWENHHGESKGQDSKAQELRYLLDVRIGYRPQNGSPIIVCDGIFPANTQKPTIGYITSLSKVLVGSADLVDGSILILQEINLQQSVALDLVFEFLQGGEKELIMGLGMDSGEVAIYGSLEGAFPSQPFGKLCGLKKHDDWVRCLAITTLDNGDRLLATGGEDSFIAIWRFKAEDKAVPDEFEFQVVQFKSQKVVFDSMIVGHEGWINSLQWNETGELISCSSDQTVIIWENVGEIWTEKVRLGVVGGQIPGGFCARFNEAFVAVSGFHGAIQIWSWAAEMEEWTIQPSVTGHFKSVSDLDYHPEGYYLVTTSEDQTTRVFSPWGHNRWHEISRPQIHGHDIFALKCSGDYIVSGAEEKILRAFQPTGIFIRNYEDASESPITLSNVAEAASLPALGLSNQSETEDSSAETKRLEERLEEDFLRSQTLWPEVSKLYGHGYEICAIGASCTDNIIVSGCNSTKPQFSTILLWCTKKWKNLGEYPFHKLNVTDLEFSNDGSRLLSVSRDRTWALWKVIPPREGQDFSLELMENCGGHTRAISVGTWAPTGHFFITGGRDKKLVVWKSSNPKEMTNYEKVHVQAFEHSVTAAAVNEDNIVAVGLESGAIFIFVLNLPESEERRRLVCLATLDNSTAHHGVVRKLKFNPKEKYQLASGSSDHSIKIYQLNPQ